jgi:dolichyl-phosphate-mannose-protein mannosyltransferase
MIARLHSYRSELLFCTIFLCATLFAAPGFSLAAGDQKNLLLNGDFAKGSEDQPDSWRTEAWINNPDSFQAHWHSNTGKPNELEVDALKANDARWMQPLTVGPGWYQLSVDVRTENVGTKESGATVSVMEDGVMSPEVHGTADWQRVTLYLKVGGHGADIDVALRVGGFGSLNSGKAFFRNASLIKIDAPPPNATPTYDLMAIRQQGQPVPIGSPGSLVVVFALLGAIAWMGWRIYGDGDFGIFDEALKRVRERPRQQ